MEKKIPSKQLQPHEPATYLGVTSQVNGSQTDQYRKLHAKADQCACKLSSTHMSHYYSHVYNNCSIIPRITYPLAATSLTSKQFHKLHASLYPSVIASKGFNRHFPNQLRFGMHKYSGLGLINLEVEQGIRKIQVLHKFLYHPKHKTLLHAIVDWHQLLSGLSKFILQHPNQKFYVSNIWLNNLPQFMEKDKITIVLANTLQFNIQRRNDKCIMDELTRVDGIIYCASRRSRWGLVADLYIYEYIYKVGGEDDT